MDDEVDRLREELAQTRRALARAAEKYSAVVDWAPDAVLIADLDSAYFTEANPAACELFGYSLAELRQLKGRLLHPQDEWPHVAEISRDIVEHGRAWHPNIRLRRKDGSVFWGELRIRVNRSEPRAYVTIVRDVTARVEREAELQASYRALQEALAHSDRLASIGQVAAGVMHEINNPAMLVLGSTELLQASLDRLRRALGRHDLSGRASDFAAEAEMRPELDAAALALENVREGIQRIGTIVRDLRTFSRVEGSASEPVALDDVARAALGMAGPQIRRFAELVTALDPVPPVLGSRTRLAQVVVNLLINAAHAVEDAGPAAHRVTIATGVEGANAVCRVSDTGCGVPEEIAPRLFEPFFTTKAPDRGTGLGLSIARDIARAHGGEVALERPEQERRGTSFVLRLALGPCSGRSAP